MKLEKYNKGSIIRRFLSTQLNLPCLEYFRWQHCRILRFVANIRLVEGMSECNKVREYKKKQSHKLYSNRKKKKRSRSIKASKYCSMLCSVFVHDELI